MFDHVTIRVADREAAERFYGAVLRTLGIEQTYRDDEPPSGTTSRSWPPTPSTR